MINQFTKYHFELMKKGKNAVLGPNLYKKQSGTISRRTSPTWFIYTFIDDN